MNRARCSENLSAHHYSFSGDYGITHAEEILGNVRRVQIEFSGYPIGMRVRQLCDIITEDATYLTAAKHYFRQPVHDSEEDVKKAREKFKTSYPVLYVGEYVNPSLLGTVYNPLDDQAAALSTAYQVKSICGRYDVTVGVIGRNTELATHLQTLQQVFDWKIVQSDGLEKIDADITFLTFEGKHNVRETISTGTEVARWVQFAQWWDAANDLVVPHFRQPDVGYAVRQHRSYDPMIVQDVRAALLYTLVK